ncbi:diguanylate cyclase [Vibrio renipiscarius]|uniref:diguanylate cyclase n=1 Tax=Vibrio renipiscarius TaxID=1461322 RepID=UPI00354F0A76
MKQRLLKLLCVFSFLITTPVYALNDLNQWEGIYASALKEDKLRALSLLQDRYNALKPGIEKLYISSKLHGFMLLHGQPYHGNPNSFDPVFGELEARFIEALNKEEKLDFLSANKGYLSLLDHANKQNSMDGRILFEYHLCRVFNRQAKYHQAAIYCSSLKTHLLDSSTSVIPPHMAYRVIANNQEFLGNYHAALDTYETLLSNIPPYVDSSGIYNDAGLLLATLGHLEKAKEYINIALDMRGGGQSPLELAQSHHSMGKTLLKQGNYQASIEHFVASKALVKKYDHLIGLSFAQLGLGQAYIAQADYQRGTRYLLNALASADEQDNNQIRGEIFLALSQAYKEQDNLLGALDFAQDALNLAESIGSERLRSQSLRLLAEIAEAQDNFSLALAYYRSYSQSELSKRDSDNRSAFVALDLASRDYANQIKIDSLSESNQSLREKIQLLESNLQYAFIAILILACTFVGYIYYCRKISARYDMDLLTGALTRSAMIREVRSKTTQSADETNYVLMLIDLDDFKSINDQFGHPTGDRVLHHVIEVIKSKMETNDIVGRLGGEEFLILLNDVDELDVNERVKQLHQAIANTPFVSETQQSLSVTASLSYLATSKALHDFDELYSILDQALYQAKRNSKNCIVDAYNDPIYLTT